MYNFSEYQVPQHTQEAILRYLDQGLEPGSFLKSVLCNDLCGALGTADHVNALCLKDIVSWVWMYAPQDSWGNEAKVLRWIKEHPARTKIGQ